MNGATHNTIRTYAEAAKIGRSGYRSKIVVNDGFAYVESYATDVDGKIVVGCGSPNISKHKCQPEFQPACSRAKHLVDAMCRFLNAGGRVEEMRQVCNNFANACNMEIDFGYFGLTLWSTMQRVEFTRTFKQRDETFIQLTDGAVEDGRSYAEFIDGFEMERIMAKQALPIAVKA